MRRQSPGTYGRSDSITAGQLAELHDGPAALDEMTRVLAPGGELVMSAELALLRSALDEAERVSRFGIEVLDGVDRGRDGESSEDGRLLREIDALAMREASLRSLQKTMAEVDGGCTPPPQQPAGPGQVSSGAVLPVPRPR